MKRAQSDCQSCKADRRRRLPDNASNNHMPRTHVTHTSGRDDYQNVTMKMRTYTTKLVKQHCERHDQTSLCRRMASPRQTKPTCEVSAANGACVQRRIVSARAAESRHTSGWRDICMTTPGKITGHTQNAQPDAVPDRLHDATWRASASPDIACADTRILSHASLRNAHRSIVRCSRNASAGTHIPCHRCGCVSWAPRRCASRVWSGGVPPAARTWQD